LGTAFFYWVLFISGDAARNFLSGSITKFPSSEKTYPAMFLPALFTNAARLRD